jgi:S-adenosylmethionine:tRNA ribosyltransferase-isomerase
MRTDELDFDLPPDLIAQVPAQRRSDARLLHFRQSDCAITHRQFTDLPSLLRPDDLLVLNDARVTPARFDLLKSTGGRVEGLFLEEQAPGRWDVLLRDVGKAPVGTELTFAADPAVKLRLRTAQGEGAWEVEVSGLQTGALEFLERVGRMPLPPYIRRGRGDAPEAAERDLAELDRRRYQTVYAACPGSVAAPTAGLHFTPELLAALDAIGVQRVAITLHVGLGTFKPITTNELDKHPMHFERYQISAEAAAALNRAKAAGRRIVAAGTTTARVLESQSASDEFSPRRDRTDLFIRPPYQWKHVGALITNFHLPRSTLIALVAAFVGLENQRQIYRDAIAQRYRFFSYGDTSFLE